MSTTATPEADQSAQLADALHELEEHEAALETRTRSLEFAGPLALVLSIVAIALGIGAFAIALSNRSDATSDSGSSSGVTAASGGPAGAPSGGMMGSGKTSSASMMTGVDGHGSFTSAQMSAAAHSKVYVQLGDYWAAPTVRSVHAGRVTFVARNVGRVPHELMVERMPMKFASPMNPDEDAAQGMIADMDPGRSGHMTVRLRPGSYMLFCNAPGHYAAGQHIPFTVTS